MIFVSYSHDSDEHKTWVSSFVAALRHRGLEVKYDRDLDFGEDIGHFMSSTIQTATRILLICTPKYVTKANGMQGGVGHESSIITAELLPQQRTNRFVPVIRARDSSSKAMPTYMGVRSYANLTLGPHYDAELEKLIQSLLRSERSPASEPTDDYTKQEANEIVPAQPSLPAQVAEETEERTHKMRWTSLLYKNIRLEPLAGGRSNLSDLFRVEAVTDVDVTMRKMSSDQRLILPLTDLSDPWEITEVNPRARLIQGELRVNQKGDSWIYHADRSASPPKEKTSSGIEGHRFQAEMTKILIYLAKRDSVVPTEAIAKVIGKETAVTRLILEKLDHMSLVIHHWGPGFDRGYAIGSSGTGWLIDNGYLG